MYYCGSFSHPTAGIKAITVGFQPVGVRVTVSQKTSTAQGFTHLSIGSSDGTRQRCDSLYQDASGGQTVKYTDRIVSHFDRASGSLTEKVSAHIDQSYVDPVTGISAAWNSTQVKYIVDTADVNYQFFVEAWG